MIQARPLRHGQVARLLSSHGRPASLLLFACLPCGGLAAAGPCDANHRSANPPTSCPPAQPAPGSPAAVSPMPQSCAAQPAAWPRGPSAAGSWNFHGRFSKALFGRPVRSSHSHSHNNNMLPPPPRSCAQTRPNTVYAQTPPSAQKRTTLYTPHWAEGSTWPRRRKPLGSQHTRSGPPPSSKRGFEKAGHSLAQLRTGRTGATSHHRKQSQSGRRTLPVSCLPT